jgi:hypothetical protein
VDIANSRTNEPKSATTAAGWRTHPLPYRLAALKKEGGRNFRCRRL